jgi:hypothetical protein
VEVSREASKKKNEEYAVLWYPRSFFFSPCAPQHAHREP